MKVYDSKNIKFRDGLVEKRRKRFILKTLFFIGLAIAIVGFILYLLFFSGLLEIKEVSVSGLDKVGNDEFNGGLNRRLNSKWLGLVEYQRSVLFFDSDAFKAEILASFPEVKDISVNKELPHTLNMIIAERETAGIWCFIDDCKYFDKEGITWGDPAGSSGFLILNINDLRQEAQTIDKYLLNNFMFIVQQLKEADILISKFTIPSNFFGDFNAFTSAGYELLFSTDSDIKRQIEVLEIFLAEKRDDSNFKPQYIDLRLNGRIYYK